MTTLQPMPSDGGESCKLITCVFPDDGSDLTLLKALREKKEIIRANSSHCFGSSIHAVAKTKPGKLPEPILARMVQIFVSESDADSVFEFVCETCNVDSPAGGVVFQGPVPFVTPYSLPDGVPDEDSRHNQPE